MQRFPKVAVGLALGWVLLGFLLARLLGPEPQSGQQLEVFGSAPAFTLTDQYERPVQANDLAGKVVVANFIYTHCQDVCPLLTQQMRVLQDRLRQEELLGPEVQLLSFTVDPARDTPAVLREYAERHQADPATWRFLDRS